MYDSNNDIGGKPGHFDLEDPVLIEIDGVNVGKEKNTTIQQISKKKKAVERTIFGRRNNHKRTIKDPNASFHYKIATQKNMKKQKPIAVTIIDASHNERKSNSTPKKRGPKKKSEKKIKLSRKTIAENEYIEKISKKQVSAVKKRPPKIKLPESDNSSDYFEKEDTNDISFDIDLFSEEEERKVKRKRGPAVHITPKQYFPAPNPVISSFDNPVLKTFDPDLPPPTLDKRTNAFSRWLKEQKRLGYDLMKELDTVSKWKKWREQIKKSVIMPTCPYNRKYKPRRRGEGDIKVVFEEEAHSNKHRAAERESSSDNDEVADSDGIASGDDSNLPSELPSDDENDEVGEYRNPCLGDPQEVVDEICGVHDFNVSTQDVDFDADEKYDNMGQPIYYTFKFPPEPKPFVIAEPIGGMKLSTEKELIVRFLVSRFMQGRNSMFLEESIQDRMKILVPALVTLRKIYKLPPMLAICTTPIDAWVSALHSYDPSIRILLFVPGKNIGEDTPRIKYYRRNTESQFDILLITRQVFGEKSEKLPHIRWSIVAIDDVTYPRHNLKTFANRLRKLVICCKMGGALSVNDLSRTESINALQSIRGSSFQLHEATEAYVRQLLRCWTYNTCPPDMLPSAIKPIEHQQGASELLMTCPMTEYQAERTRVILREYSQQLISNTMDAETKFILLNRMYDACQFPSLDDDELGDDTDSMKQYFGGKVRFIGELSQLGTERLLAVCEDEQSAQILSEQLSTFPYAKPFFVPTGLRRREVREKVTIRISGKTSFTITISQEGLSKYLAVIKPTIIICFDCDWTPDIPIRSLNELETMPRLVRLVSMNSIEHIIFHNYWQDRSKRPHALLTEEGFDPDVAEKLLRIAAKYVKTLRGVKQDAHYLKSISYKIDISYTDDMALLPPIDAGTLDDDFWRNTIPFEVPQNFQCYWNESRMRKFIEQLQVWGWSRWQHFEFERKADEMKALGEFCLKALETKIDFATLPMITAIFRNMKAPNQEDARFKGITQQFLLNIIGLENISRVLIFIDSATALSYMKMIYGLDNIKSIDREKPFAGWGPEDDVMLAKSAYHNGFIMLEKDYPNEDERVCVQDYLVDLVSSQHFRLSELALIGTRKSRNIDRNVEEDETSIQSKRIQKAPVKRRGRPGRGRGRGRGRPGRPKGSRDNISYTTHPHSRPKPKPISDSNIKPKKKRISVKEILMAENGGVIPSQTEVDLDPIEPIEGNDTITIDENDITSNDTQDQDPDRGIGIEEHQMLVRALQLIPIDPFPHFLRLAGLEGWPLAETREYADNIISGAGGLKEPVSEYTQSLIKERIELFQLAEEIVKDPASNCQEDREFLKAILCHGLRGNLESPTLVSYCQGKVTEQTLAGRLKAVIDSLHEGSSGSLPETLPSTDASFKLADLIQMDRFGQIVSRDEFHTKNFIFPIGYEASVAVASIDDPNTLIWATCKIAEENEKPVFLVSLVAKSGPLDYRGGTPDEAWEQYRKDMGENGKNLYFNGYELFGFWTPAFHKIVGALTSPQECQNYVRRLFRNPSFDLKSDERAKIGVYSPPTRLSPKVIVMSGTPKENREENPEATNVHSKTEVDEIVPEEPSDLSLLTQFFAINQSDSD